MIKFFRKIRYDLMDKNKTGKYLKYAIGEIILVVIGILIALSINNWSSLNKEKRILLSHLQTIKENLKNDESQLLEMRKFRMKSAEMSTKIIDQYKSGIIEDQVDFMETFMSIASERKFDSDQSGFQRIKSTSMFDSEELSVIREKILEYNKVVDATNFMEFRQNSQTEKLESELWSEGFYDEAWSEFRIFSNPKKYNNSKDKVDFYKLIEKHGEVKGILLRNEFFVIFVIKQYDEIIEKGKELSNEIENYINKK
ncbi:DUF6090 family protein [Gaetbulibacter sp. M240]|uniref:DUF6090 family protein n=1 Tax=Gaetbulibacter sp. M240 TaxID=3126511 RepID=UPI00374E4A1B